MFRSDESFAVEQVDRTVTPDPRIQTVLGGNGAQS